MIEAHPLRAWAAAVGCALVLGCTLVLGCAGAKPVPDDSALDQAPGSSDIGAVQNPGPAQKRKPQHGQSRQPTLREAQVVRELMSDAENVRGLRFARPVPVLVQDRERITDYVETQIETDELERSRVVYAALGLLPADLDVRSLLLRLMGEQIVGYYDADEKSLSVRDDVMRAFARGDDDDGESDLTEARIVLVHELVHALQDQNLGLSDHIHAPRDTDADNAFHALVEGDATLAMIGYALQREQVPLHKLTGNPAQVRSFSDVVRKSPLAGTELEQAPAIVRIPLLSAYVDGLSFCASLHGAAGWPGVDRAHAQPPVSTEQVLHPERFAHADAPQKIELPELPQLAAAGYTKLQDDTLGELEMSVYFGQGTTEEEGRRAADGWGGDRLRVYQSKTAGPAVVWLSSWDDDAAATRAEQAAQRAQAQAPAALRERCEVERQGRMLLVLRDLPKELRAGVVARFSATGLAGEPAAPAAIAPKIAVPSKPPATPAKPPAVSAPAAH